MKDIILSATFQPAMLILISIALIFHRRRKHPLTAAAERWMKS